MERRMEKLVINGGRRLSGRVKISGAKNAVLPIIAATLLGQDAPSLLDEVPALEDVHTITEVLKKLGVKAEFSPEKHQLYVDSSVIGSCEAPYDLVRKMRASFLIMGPLLARCGQARISLPGGTRSFKARRASASMRKHFSGHSSQMRYRFTRRASPCRRRAGSCRRRSAPADPCRRRPCADACSRRVRRSASARPSSSPSPSPPRTGACRRSGP